MCELSKSSRPSSEYYTFTTNTCTNANMANRDAVSFDDQTIGFTTVKLLSETVIR